MLLLFQDSGSSSTELDPSSGAIAVAGNTPSLVKAFAPSTGVVSVAGNATSLSLQLAPSDGQIAVIGESPSLSLGYSPSTGEIGVAGEEVSLSVGTILEAEVGAIGVSGNGPSISLLVPDDSFSAGWSIPSQTAEQRKARRIALGILPPDKQEEATAAVEMAVEASVSLAKAKPETQEATDALEKQRRAEALFASVYLSVYPALEESSIRELLAIEAQKAAMEEKAFAVALMML